jgi:multidrug efflux pump subunit AcrA (membrane-fusion protein)
MAASCHPSKTEEELPAEETEIITPVTITPAMRDTMVEFIELNATSVFLRKAYIKASSNGYIKMVNAQAGHLISAGQIAFILKTKEAESIGNTINLLDSSFKFSGIISIRAATAGYVSEVNHQVEDYVQEGEQLAVINDIKSFVFMLNLPYELRTYVLNRKTVELLLPDGKSMPGRISAIMPIVDSSSQTQNITITVDQKDLPANLIAKVKVVKTQKPAAISLPKQSVLSDETQTVFWVMKVINDSTAIKIQVKKGLEINERIEIVSPVFLDSDRFLLTGNYGLSDTARIVISR